MPHSHQRTKAFSRTFTEVVPYAPNRNEDPGWRDGLVTGNGEDGVVCSCSPYSETLTYQNIWLIMPSPQPRTIPPELRSQLDEARQAVIQGDDRWDVHGRERTFLYCYHPGHQVRIQAPPRPLHDYLRWTDYETGEIGVRYRDEGGTWERKTFTSRSDHVTITEFKQSDTGTKLHLRISLDDLAGLRKFGQGDEVNLQYKKLVTPDGSALALVAHYPSYAGSELRDGGYAGVTTLFVVGGEKKRILLPSSPDSINVGRDQNPAVEVTGAEAVYLVSQTARTHTMGASLEFASQERFELLDRLNRDLQRVIERYTRAPGDFDYAGALGAHVALHGPLFRGVTLHLDGDGHDATNEELILAQSQKPELHAALIERVYHQGRFAQICCAGTSAPRLCGLWTGEWNPGWRGAYTIDANVNLQVSGMNTGNVPEAALGYISFLLRQIPDWEENATQSYGMHDALLPPVNTDGDCAVLVEYDHIFPFQYWNAGASWLLLPIFEFWQCFGNRTIAVTDPIRHLFAQDALDLERDVLRPLLTKQAHFWEQLCTPEYFTDTQGRARYQKGKKELREGERYLIIPSYSPENKPKRYDSAMTANATMDISAARDGLNMAITLERKLALAGYETTIARWEALLARLPEYQLDETGALREWAMLEYEENNEHRHISHLYVAWPAYEAQKDKRLTEACRVAIENRNRENQGKDDVASHGWVHKALVAARLKDASSVAALLHTLVSSGIYFSSLMADHNVDRSCNVYCTDTTMGTVGIINEMLVYSDSTEIELLPALPHLWRKGEVGGLRVRTNAEVMRLAWDLDQASVEVSLRADHAQVVRLSCRGQVIEEVLALDRGEVRQLTIRV